MTVFNHSIRLALVVFCALLGLGAGGVLAQGIEVDYARYLPSSYTDGFKRGFEIRFSGKARVDSQDLEVTGSVEQQAGTASRFGGKDWIEVKQSGYMKFGPEETEVALIQLYDPRTRLQAFEIDSKDQKIKSFDWMALPKTLRLGEIRLVGRTQEKDKDEKLVSEGTISYRLTTNKFGHEFCRIEVTRDLESNEETGVEDCDQFSRSGRISGSRVVIRVDEDTTIELTGKFRFN